MTPRQDAPAILGGDPMFPEGLPLTRPSLPDPSAVLPELDRVLSGTVLTDGPLVRELEGRVAEYVGVRHCVAVASCTAGLMLLLRAADLSGDVVVPSFTFAATAHAVAWNGLRPAFADIDPATLTLDPLAVRGAVGAGTSAILATHTFGTPCDVDGLEAVAREASIRILFDAAHALGARHGNAPVGRFGEAEVFSLSPTKPVVAGEGGLIATDDDDLAEGCRLGRDYGKEPGYDFRFVGLNGRMSELHAALALASFDGVDERIEERNALARRYREVLSPVPGLSFPEVRRGDVSTYKDFTLLVDPQIAGVEAPTLARALGAEGIETRRYYAPPVHRARAYASLPPPPGGLPVTEWAAERVLTLPLWNGMTEGHQAGVARAFQRIRAHHDRIRAVGREEAVRP